MQLALAKEKSAKKILFRMQAKHVCNTLYVCVYQCMCAWLCVLCVCVYLHSLQMKFGSSFTFDFRSY